MNSLTYVVANLAALVIGQWLVTRGHWAGFLVWCAANFHSIVTCRLTGLRSMTWAGRIASVGN